MQLLYVKNQRTTTTAIQKKGKTFLNVNYWFRLKKYIIKIFNSLQLLNSLSYIICNLKTTWPIQPLTHLSKISWTRTVLSIERSHTDRERQTNWQIDRLTNNFLSYHPSFRISIASLAHPIIQYHYWIFSAKVVQKIINTAYREHLSRINSILGSYPCFVRSLIGIKMYNYG